MPKKPKPIICVKCEKPIEDCVLEVTLSNKQKIPMCWKCGIKWCEKKKAEKMIKLKCFGCGAKAVYYNEKDPFYDGWDRNIHGPSGLKDFCEQCLSTPYICGRLDFYKKHKDARKRKKSDNPPI